MGLGFESQQDHASNSKPREPVFSGFAGLHYLMLFVIRLGLNEDDVAVVADVALLDVVQELNCEMVSFQKQSTLYSVSLVAVAIACMINR